MSLPLEESSVWTLYRIWASLCSAQSIQLYMTATQELTSLVQRSKNWKGSKHQMEAVYIGEKIKLWQQTVK